MGFLSWVPVIGDVVDTVLGVTNQDEVGRSNASNEKIAKWNIEQQQRTNEMNRQNVLDTNNMNQAIAQQYNANQVQLQNDMNVFNKQMWDLNNQYNSPSAQLQRAKDAGINPNIVFGQPVASSPVQQTAIPQQQMAQMQAYKADAPQNDYKRIARQNFKLSQILNSLAKIPFVREELDSKKLENEATRLSNKSKKIDNELREYDLESKRDAFEQYRTNNSVINLDTGDVISRAEFDSLSDDDKKPFMSHVTQPDGSDSYRANTLNLFFTTPEGFEEWKKIRNIGNYINNIKADDLQNRLRAAVAKGQIEDSDVVRSMIKMPTAQLNNLEQTFKNLKQTYKWNEDTKQVRSNILNLEEEEMRRAASHDLMTYIDKIDKGDMGWKDWLKMALVVMSAGFSKVKAR